MYLASRWYIHLNRLWIIIYIIFGSNKLHFFLKEQLFPPWSGQFWQIKIKKLVTHDLTYSSNTFLGLFYVDFLLPWRHLLLSYTLWLLKISFLRCRSSHRKVLIIVSWNKCKTSNKRFKEASLIYHMRWLQRVFRPWVIKLLNFTFQH